ncbi:MAG: hypothetical protein V2I33_14785 [Kangiellaceae bacterium]|jgi:type II secretory pathway component PulF|nr:hypothetical protein [Kangiellaceae bacterium]
MTDIDDDFIERQLFVLVSNGESIKDAVAKLKSINNTATNQAAEQLLSNYQNTNNWPQAVESWRPNSLISSLIKSLDSYKPDTSEDSIDAVKLQAQFYAKAKMMAQMKKFLGEKLAMLTAITMVLLLTMLLITWQVLPNFQEIFISFGNDLPSLTVFMIDFSGVMSSFIAVIVVVSLILLVLLKKKSLEQFSQSPLVRITPLFNNFSGALSNYNQDIIEINFLNTNSQHRYRERLKIAEQLNNRPNEMELIGVELLIELEKTIYRSTRNFFMFIQTTTIVVIGLLLIALYLPIFSFGAVV